MIFPGGIVQLSGLSAKSPQADEFLADEVEARGSGRVPIWSLQRGSAKILFHPDPLIDSKR